MWELPNDRSDFARKQGNHAGHAKNTGGIPYSTATSRASRVQTRKRNTWPHSQPEVDDGERQGTPERPVHVLHRLQEGLRLRRPKKTVGDSEGYGSASTRDSVTEKAVHQPGSDSQDGVGRDRQHRHWERRAIWMYPLTTTIQYLRRKHNERGFGRMGEWNQHRREDGDEPEIRRRYNTARWDQGRLDKTCGKSHTSQ